MKYAVTISQTIDQRATLIVEAKNQQEAEAAARSLVCSGDDAKVGWFTTDSDTEYDVEEDDRDRKPDFNAADFDDLEDFLDECDDPDDTTWEDTLAEWNKKRWRVELHPKTGITADVSIVARDLTHAEAMRLMMEHNDGPYPTWARMKEEEV